MRIKTVLNNCLYEILNNNIFDNIYIYGSKKLELVNIISKLTSSSLVGGDVDFYNSLLGSFYKDNTINYERYLQIKKIFNIENDLTKEEYISLCLIYRDNQKIFNTNNIHFDRLRRNIIENKEYLIKQTIEKLKSNKIQLNGFYEENFVNFHKRLRHNDLLILDNREAKINLGRMHFDNFIIISNNQISMNFKDVNLVKYEGLYIYSDLLTNKLYKNTPKTAEQFNLEEITTDDKIDEIVIKELNIKDFNILRKRYLSIYIRYLGKPKVCYAVFNQNNKLIGAFGLTNDYRNKVSENIEKPYIYLLSDFCVNSNIKHLIKLVLSCILSKEVKLLSERLIKQEVKTIVTNVFTKNAVSMKYRNDFKLSNRKKMKNGYNNLTYYSPSGKWSLKEGLEVWKQKLLE